MFAATTKPPKGKTYESILFVTQRCIQNCRYILISNILKIVACNITFTQYKYNDLQFSRAVRGLRSKCPQVKTSSLSSS